MDSGAEAGEWKHAGSDFRTVTVTVVVRNSKRSNTAADWRALERVGYKRGAEEANTV